ncbi:MAG: hypothetical protein GY938_05085 [Ketobacter sp.]|nr:hypothetical protein [Ketobacter sp.]
MMISAQEVQTIKNNWRIVAYFVGAFWGIVGILYAGGFVDLPANAGDVQIIQDTVKSNKKTINRVDANVRSLQMDVEVSKTKQKSVDDKLKAVSDSQRDIQRDIKTILQLMIKNG